MFYQTNRTQAAERAERCRFVHVFHPCEFGANPFSYSRDISYTNKNDGAKNKTFRSSLRAVIMQNNIKQHVRVKAINTTQQHCQK